MIRRVMARKPLKSTSVRYSVHYFAESDTRRDGFGLKCRKWAF